MGGGMEDHPADLPVRGQDRGRVDGRCIHIQAQRPQSVSTMHEDLTQSHRRRGSEDVEAPLCCRSESISQFCD